MEAVAREGWPKNNKKQKWSDSKVSTPQEGTVNILWAAVDFYTMLLQCYIHMSVQQEYIMKPSVWMVTS